MKKIPLLLLIGLLYAGPARAFTVEHDFTVILGPFNASKTRFTYALTPDSYAVNSTVKTDGMFNALYPLKPTMPQPENRQRQSRDDRLPL